MDITGTIRNLTPHTPLHYRAKVKKGAHPCHVDQLFLGNQVVSIILLDDFEKQREVPAARVDPEFLVTRCTQAPNCEFIQLLDLGQLVDQRPHLIFPNFLGFFLNTISLKDAYSPRYENLPA